MRRKISGSLDNFKKEFLSFNSGVTLVALIVTIIILLILAGVSISALVGNNGILKQATNAADKAEIEDAREKIALEVVGSYDDSGRFHIDKLKENLSNNLEIDTSGIGNSLPTGTFYYNDLHFYIDEDLQVIYRRT